jgi:CheY-like chemotaxis protein
MLEGKKVLIVEDDIRAMNNYKFNFSEMEELAQIIFQYAVNSKETIAILENDPPDLIYLDLSLGESRNPEGMDILKRYSGRFNIIVVSGFGEYEAQCMVLGAKGYITKPILDFITMLEEGEKVLNLKTSPQQRT